MMTTIDTNPHHDEDDKALVALTDMKAGMIAFINSSPGPVKFRQVADSIKSKLEKYNYKENNLRSVLDGLANNKLISISRTSEGVYFSAANATVRTPNDTKRQNNVAVTTPPVAKGQMHEVKEVHKKPVAVATDSANTNVVIDIVRSTGRIRIISEGMTIEIGITDK